MIITVGLWAAGGIAMKMKAKAWVGWTLWGLGGADIVRTNWDKIPIGQPLPHYPPIIYQGPLWPTDMDDWARDWRDSQHVQQYVCPLILDLNRDGKLDMKNWSFFDFSANGMHELASWIDPGDAFLVLDLNGNGIIDNGSEMFGTSTVLPNGMLALNGWDALRQYDSDGNGKIDANDEIFGSLMVLTGDGKLMSLADAGIKSITLPPLPGVMLGSAGFTYQAATSSNGGSSSGSTNSSSVEIRWFVNLGDLGRHVLPKDWDKLTWQEQNQYITDLSRRLDAERMANGGTFGSYSVFEWEDGTTSQIVDAYPYRIPMYSIAAEWLEVPEDIAALPDLIGFGNKHDLHQAMVRDESGALRALVEQYMAETNPAAREKIFVDILYKWAGVEDVVPNSRGWSMDARQVAFLEMFFGDDFTGANGANPNNEAAARLKTLFADITRSMEMSLLAQTHLKPLFDNMGYDFTEPVLDENGKIIQQGMLNVSLDPAIEWLGELARTGEKAA